MIKMTLPARLGMSVSGLKVVEDIASICFGWVCECEVEEWKQGMLLLLRYWLGRRAAQLSNQIL